MKKTIRRLVSLLCMLCILASFWLPLLPAAPAERASAAPVSASRELTATDGSRWLVTVSYDTASGIPEGAELRVRELLPSDEGYAELLARSALVLGGGEESISFARALDISLLDPETGEEYQPEGSVQVSIALLDTALEAYPGVEVLHFGDEVELMDAAVNGEAVEFETEGFSIYLVVAHEGEDVVETSRIMFHFIDSVFSDNGEEGYGDLANGVLAALPYYFLNESSKNSNPDASPEDYQTTQVLRSEVEKLEMITNPPTRHENGVEKFYYGWYVVNYEGMRPSSDPQKEDEIKYSWPSSDLVQIPYECYVKLDPVQNVQVGAEIDWYLGEKRGDAVVFSQTPSGTGVLGADGYVHVYLAPIYEDFYFVNFHMGPLDSEQGLRDSIRTRKLLVFGSATSAQVRIDDVESPSADARHQVFVGWQTEEMSTRPVVKDQFYRTVAILEEDDPDIVSVINVDKSEDPEVKSYDLYPYFEEARWLNFSTGLSSNGASYVSPRFLVTNDSGVGNFLNKDELENETAHNTVRSQRSGYNLNGWYANAVLDSSGKITNLDSAKELVLLVKDDAARADDTIYTYTEEPDPQDPTQIKKTPNYIDMGGYAVFVAQDGIVQIKLSLQAEKLIETTGNEVGEVIAPTDVNSGTPFRIVDQNGMKQARITYKLTADGTEKTVTLYGVKDGKLYFYQGLDDLKLEANWEANEKTTYKVVIWKQKITDHVLTKESDKTYDFEVCFTSDSVRFTDPVNLNGFSGTYLYSDANGVQQTRTVNNLDLLKSTSLEGELKPRLESSFTGFELAWNDWNAPLKPELQVTLQPDGTTIYNVYYDRNVRTLTFQVNSGSSYNYSMEETSSVNNDPQQYGLVDGRYIPLTREVEGTRHTYTYEPAYKATADKVNVCYGFVNGAYVPLTATPVTEEKEEEKDIYLQTNTLAAGKDYLIVSSSGYALGYDLSGANATASRKAVTVKPATEATGNKTFIEDGVDPSAVWSVSAGSNNTYKFQNGGYYLRRPNGNTLQITKDDSFNTWTWDGTNNRLSISNRYLRYYNNSFSLHTDTNSVYLYEKTTITERQPVVVGYTYSYNGQPYTGRRYLRSDTAEYTGTRYTDSECTQRATDNGHGQFGKDANGVTFPLTYASETIYKWTYDDDQGEKQTYPYTRFILTPGNSTDWNTIYQIKALYGQNISRNFPIMDAWNGGDYDKGERWQPNGSNLFSQVLVYLDTMPDEDTVFRHNTSNYTIKTLNYFVEVLPGDTPERTRNGVGYKEYHVTKARYNFLTEKEDFLELEGFSKLEANPAFAWDNYYRESRIAANILANNNNTADFYYTRNVEKFTFDVNYPTEYGVSFNGVDQDDPNVQKSSSIFLSLPYETPLQKYGPATSAGENGKDRTTWYFGIQDGETNFVADDGIELLAPDHYIFGGWYEDVTCTKKFNFDSTMPAANKVVYAKWTPEKFRIMIDPNGAEIDHIDHTGDVYTAETFEDDDVKVNIVQVLTDQLPGAGLEDLGYSVAYPENTSKGYNKTQATYFNNKYQEPIGSYTVEREFVPISDAASALYNGDIYYYVNTQSYIDGNRTMQADLRNALFLRDAEGDWDSAEYQDSSELYQYWKFYYQWQTVYRAAHPNDDTIHEPVKDYDQWRQLFLARQENGEPQKYRKVQGKETYTFLGWYEVTNMGGRDDNWNEAEEQVADMPYDFTKPTVAPVALRAMWRLDGGFTIQYHADCQVGDKLVNGTLLEWEDPPVQNYTYAELADTNIYKQPTEITVGGDPTDDYIFRGYRLVLPQGESGKGQYVYLEDDGKFYQPGDPFFVQADFADENNVIHFQAIYEKREEAYRRPAVTSLILNAGIGSLVTGSSSQPVLPDEVGSVTLDGGNNELVFNDLQSNLNLHLYRYATDLRIGNVTGTSFFTYADMFELLGFDRNSGEEDYLADYPSNSVIAVPRNEQENRLFAVWEPMVYVTFVNETAIEDPDDPFAGGDIVFTLECPDDDGANALQIINQKVDRYKRLPLSDATSFTVEAGETLTLAIPRGMLHRLKVQGRNELGPGILLSADLTRDLGQSITGEQKKYKNVKNTQGFSFTLDHLLMNPDGLEVTFTAIQNSHTLELHDNFTDGAIGGKTQEVYFHEDEDEEEGYVPFFKSYTLVRANTRPLYKFVGWAETPDATEAVYKPGEDSWTISDPPSFFKKDGKNVKVRKLYAVWELDLTAQEVNVLNLVPDPGNQNKPFTYKVGFSAPWTYSVEGQATASGTMTAEKSFQLQAGQYLWIKTHQTTSVSDNSAELVMDVEVRAADGTVIHTDKVSDSLDKAATFDNENMSMYVKQNLETDYSTEYVVAETVHDGDIQNNTAPEPGFEGVFWTDTDAGGVVRFTNTIDEYYVTVSKTLIGNVTSGQFSFPWSYVLDKGESYQTDPVEGTLIVSTETPRPLKIPSGASLVLSETIGSKYLAEYSVDNGTPRSGKTWEPNDVIREAHSVAFTNTLRSVRVQFYLVDQDKQPTVDCRFSLSTAAGSTLGQGLLTVGNGGKFYESSVFYVDDYVLEQRTTKSGYLGVTGRVGLTLSYDEDLKQFDLSSDNPYVQPEYDSEAGIYKVYVYNLKYVDVPVRCVLVDELLEADPYVNSRSFDFRASYSFDRHGIVISGAPTFSLMPRAGSAEGAVSTIRVPLGAELTVSEKYENVFSTVATWGGSPVTITNTSINNAAWLTVPPENAAERTISGRVEVVFTNTRQRTTVTVKKEVLETSDTNSFTFAASLFNPNRKPIGNYNAGGASTGSDGTMSFSLSGQTGSDTLVLTLPAGAWLVVEETAVVSSDPAVKLDDYATTVTAAYTLGGSYTNMTQDTSKHASVSLSSLPGDELTITFTNGPAGVDVSFRKINSNGQPLPGASFAVYDTYANAWNGGAVGRQTLRTGENSSSTLFVSDGSGRVSFQCKYGIWYLRETDPPSGYEENTAVYQLAVGKAGTTVNGVVAIPSGADFLIRRMTDASTVEANGPDIAAYGILNTSAYSRRVILRKADDGNGTTDAFQMLQGAHFRIFRPDLTEVTQGQEAGKTFYESLSSGVWFIGSLNYGKYYLLETQAPTRPSGYSGNVGKVYAMKVTESGVVFDPNDVPNANLTGADEEAVVSKFKTWYAGRHTS